MLGVGRSRRAHIGWRNHCSHRLVVIGRDLEAMSVRVREIGGEGPGVVEHAKRIAAVAEAQRPSMAEEGEEALAIDPKGDPMPAGGPLGPLRPSLEQRELGAAAIGREHEGPSRVLGPGLGPGHRVEPQSAGIPGGSLRPIWDEELNVVNGELQDWGAVHFTGRLRWY